MGFGDVFSAGASLYGGYENRQTQEDINNQNVAMQLALAQNGVTWKVEDAKRAGINPLAALGVQTQSFSNQVGDTSFGTGIAQAGQDLGRAINAATSPADKAEAAERTKLDLESKSLDNAIKRASLASSLAKTTGAGNGPGVPSTNTRYLIDGQGPTAVKVEPLKRISSSPDNPSQEVGAVSDIGYVRTPTGYAPVPSKDAMERMSNDMAGMANWSLRNRVIPMIGANTNPPMPGYTYNPMTWEYQPPGHRTSRYKTHAGFDPFTWEDFKNIFYRM